MNKTFVEIVGDPSQRKHLPHVRKVFLIYQKAKYVKGLRALGLLI
jgi:hypothetical protein